MDDTTILVTWDVVNVTKAELIEFTTSTGSDKGEHITSMLKNTILTGIVRTVRSQTRNTNENGRPSLQIETEV